MTWGERLCLLVIALLGCLMVYVVGASIYDYSTSVLQIHEVLITNKNFIAGHYTHDCHIENLGDDKTPIYYESCHDTWHPPEWWIHYSDETNHQMQISNGFYDIVRIGDKRWVKFWEGGYWHMRYDEVLLLEKPQVEQ
jgi:hypothetical protein